MQQCSPQKVIAGKMTLQNSALQNFGQAKNYINDYDDIVGGGSFNGNAFAGAGATSQNIDQYIKQLSSSTQVQQQEAVKAILQFASSDNYVLKQHLKFIVSNCSVMLRESTGNSLKSDLKNWILSLYEIFLTKYIEESELLIGNEISLILLNLGDEQWIVRQKSINSFHSILVSESKNISWNAPEIVELTVSSVGALHDENVHLIVQFTKCEQFSIITKKLPRDIYEKLKIFVEGQQLLGNIPPTYQLDSTHLAQNPLMSQYQSNMTTSQSNQPKQIDPLSTSFQPKFASLGQNIIQSGYQQANISTIPKSQSSIIHKNVAAGSMNQGKDNQSPIKITLAPNDTVSNTLEINQIRSDVSLQAKNNPDLNFGFIPDQIYQDLLDDKDWRARTSAVEEINSQIDNIQEFTILFDKLEEFLLILIKLINDTNFKISLTALQIVCKISKHDQFNNPHLLELIIPQIVSKLGDSKVAIRSQVIKIMREHIKQFGQFKWLDSCLSGLRTKNSNAKEEVLSFVTQLYQDLPVMSNYNWDKVIREVSPLIEDQKTKIKIKCVECLVIVTMKTNKESCKKLIATLFNKVYNEMYLEKLQQRIVEKSQEEAYLSSQQTSIYSSKNRTNESFRQRENDLKFNFIDSNGNLAQSGAGSFHFNYKQFDADTSHTNSFRTQVTSTTPEKYQIQGQTNQSQFPNASSYNPMLQGFGQQTQYTNTQSQFNYPFEPSSSNLFGSLISPMQTQNRILSQNEADISLFSQITEDGQIFRSNNQQRDFSSYSMYRQNPNSYGNYTLSGSGNKQQPHSSSSSVRGFMNQDQTYQQNSMNEIGRTPDSRFSQRTTNTMSTSSNTMFPQIVNNQNKQGYTGYSQGLLEISTSSSSRSAVKPGLSQSNNMNPILGNSQLTGVEQLKLSRQNIRGVGGSGYDSSYSNIPYQRGNSAQNSNAQLDQAQYNQNDYSPLKTNIEEIQYSFVENKQKPQVSNLPPLAPSRKISQVDQTTSQNEQQDEQPSFSAKKISKQSSLTNKENKEDIQKPKLKKKTNKKKKSKVLTKKKLAENQEEEEDSENQQNDDILKPDHEEEDEEEQSEKLDEKEDQQEGDDEEEDNDVELENDEEEEEEEQENEEEEEEEEDEEKEEDEEEEENEQEDEEEEEEEQEDQENENEEEENEVSLDEKSENNSDEKEGSSESNSNSTRQKLESQSSESSNSNNKDERQNSKMQKKLNKEIEQSEKENKQNPCQFQKGDIILNYSTQKNLEEFTMSTFDRQIKENYTINQSISNQNNQKAVSSHQGKIAVKNKEFNPPLNLYKGSQPTNSQEEQEEKIPSSYQYKPYLMKKGKRLSVEANQNNSSVSNAENLAQNSSQLGNQNSNADSGSNNLVIESREYIFKNPPTINEDPAENSPNSLSSKVPTKNMYRRPKRNSGSVTNKDEIQEIEEEEEKKILKPNLRNLKKKVVKQTPASEPQITQQQSANQKYSAFDAQKQSYLTKGELEPLSNPEQTLKYVLADLKIDDWSRQFEGLNNLRRINQHHSDLLSNQNVLHGIMTELLKLVENLRSSLAKNAMITLTEISEKLKRGLDTESEAIVTKLLKKGMDSNSFILEEVKNALVTVCQNCSEYKILSIIAGKYQHKAINFKMSIALMLHTLVEKSSNKILQMKDVDKLLFILSLYTMDGALEVRNYSKKTFSLLLSNTLNRSEIDKILVRMLSDQQYQKIKQFIEKESTNPESLYISGSTQNKTMKGLSKGSSILIPSANTSSQLIPAGSVSSQLIPPTIQKNQSSSSSIQDDPQGQETDDKGGKLSSMPNIKNLTLKQTQSVKLKDPSEFENIPQYFALSENADWKQRIEGVQKLTDLASSYADQLIKSKYSNKYFDNYMNLINDSNSKVSAQALTSFLGIVSSLKGGIESNLPVVFNSVCQAIGSTLNTNKQLGEQIYNKITETVDIGLLFSQLCNGASFAPVKAKQIILKTLIDQGQEMYEKKGALFVKQINQTISKLLDENKPELRPICKQLITKVNQIIGNSIFDGITAAKKKLIQDILSVS